MKLLPEYSKSIVVAIIYQKKWLWLVTPKEDWFLDYHKWGQAAFGPAYVFPDGEPGAERGGIGVLNEQTIERYLELMCDYVASVDDLTQLVTPYEPMSRSDEIIEAAPSLLVDFDEKRLVNSFFEPSGMFEDFAPDGWIAKYGGFLDKIPNEQRYWILDGKDYLSAG